MTDSPHGWEPGEDDGHPGQARGAPVPRHDGRSRDHGECGTLGLEPGSRLHGIDDVDDAGRVAGMDDVDLDTGQARILPSKALECPHVHPQGPPLETRFRAGRDPVNAEGVELELQRRLL